MRYRFTLIARNHGYWKIYDGADFASYEGRHPIDSQIGRALLQVFSDSDYFPKIFKEDPVEFIAITPVESMNGSMAE